jgi:response regulator RpfG family c-di-GMP phosphodiesterase
MGERYALILSDIVMPGLDGTQFYLHVRRIDPSQASRFVFMTSCVPDDGPTRAFFDHWAEEILKKPLARGSLLARVQGRLAQA